MSAFEVVDDLAKEYAELERKLAEPDVHADQAKAREFGRRYAELGRILQTHQAWQNADSDLEAAVELAAEDSSFAAEVEALRSRKAELEEQVRRLLAPRDPSDDKDAIVEVKAGEGGEESALFAGDLLRMYSRYAEQVGFRTELLDVTESDLGGYKDVTLAVKVRQGTTPEAGIGPYGLFKFEGGVHRVQRVPVTESQGRIHTSAAGVLVSPEAEEHEVEIDDKDLRIDVFRSSGPGGQSVNTTDSAVRITHEPTGVVVSCQNERSQLQNRERAMRMLRAKLLALQEAAVEEEQAKARRSQVRTVDRSERVRTYNFPENRISDHRTGYKAYNLDQVLAGQLDPVIRSLVDAESAARLAAAQE